MELGHAYSVLVVSAAQKFNDILNAFPAKQIAELIGVDEMPLYS